MPYERAPERIPERLGVAVMRGVPDRQGVPEDPRKEDLLDGSGVYVGTVLGAVERASLPAQSHQS
jgi:hypothetical protein